MTFVGTGGVGKTSLSVAVAIRAAMLGKRVAAITVDPSRRLTSLLDLEGAGRDSASVNWDSFSGSLDIYYVDTPRVFREFVSSRLGAPLFSKLEKNGIYQQISKNLRETHNFAALYKMVQILSKDEYDLVILDTPPCNQVIEFFESPRRLQKFFTGHQKEDRKGWLNWIQDKGVTLVEGFLKTLVGGEFVKEMDGFFQAVGSLKNDINEITELFIKHLTDPQARMILIFPPSLDKVEDAHFLMSELSRNEFKVTDFVLNRAYPGQLDQGRELLGPEDSIEMKLYNYYSGQRSHALNLVNGISKGRLSRDQDFYLIPEINQKIDSSEDILKFANQVGENWQKLSL